MKRILHFVLSSIGIGTASAQTPVIAKSEFTQAVAEALRQADTTLRVDILNDLRLKTSLSDGREVNSFLDNAYAQYEQDPSEKGEVIQRIVTSTLETLDTMEDRPDRGAIVPIVKDRAWLSEVGQASTGKGSVKFPENVYEDLNSDLVIVYAFDSPRNIRYLSPENLDSLNLKRSELRALACENLERLLPKIEVRGQDGYYMITAGGDYEASLILIDGVLSNNAMEVRGETIIAIPTRDLLLVTGNRDPENIQKMKDLVKQVSSDGTSYRLTDKLFILRKGKLVEFIEE
jgi:uncharacterized protein YtpQ (UPF0354 family)